MKVISCTAENFSSYERLEFNFTDQGLTLIQGPTGAGKSTLCDLIPWCLFGQTAKGGAVSEVLAWPGDKVTKVTLVLENVEIIRIRGKAKDNDLYWDRGEGPIRGKDLIDTQQRIEAIIGFDYDAYMAGAYYHEFSQTAQFFSTTAKNRRLITEQLVDLSLATNLQVKSQDAKKAIAKQLTSLESKSARLEAEHKAAISSLHHAGQRALKWDAEAETLQAMTQTRSDNFERDREIDLNEARRGIQTHKGLILPLPATDLYPKCPTCGQATETPEVCAARRQDTVNSHSLQRIEILSEKIKEIKLRINPHKTEIVSTSVNPHTAEVMALKDKVAKLEAAQADALVSEHETKTKIEDHELLQEVIADYRSTVIKTAIQNLEYSTNQLFTDHFDAEIRVAFTAQDADKLEVAITKDGNDCSFTQLSKGQRCLLKLAFGVSVMKAVANHGGVDFQQLFFDEALDGLDDTNKIKAFSLLQSLALNKDVFVVEHSEALKPMFLNSYSVSLVDGKSQLEKA